MARPRRTKRLLQTRAVRFSLSLLMSLAMRVIYATNRVEKHFDQEVIDYLRGGKPAVFCFWHGRMIMHPFVKPKGRPMYVLISHHNDGALITATMKWFGIDSVRGSRKLGGTKAIRQLLDSRHSTGNICITPDGPRGPFQKAASGAAFVAAKTGYPLIAVTFSSTKHVRFRSWDKFMLPKLFGKIVFTAFAPVYVADDTPETLEATTVALEIALNAVTEKADRLCGVIA